VSAVTLYDDLARELERIAERIVERGTSAEPSALGALADAAAGYAPGAAAALLDEDAAEVLRLRAFGTLHGMVLTELDDGARGRLHEQLLGTGELTAGVRAA